MTTLTAQPVEGVPRASAPAVSYERAVDEARRAFPFAEYFPPGFVNASTPEAARVLRAYLKPGARVLDFGSGPCDLAGVLSRMGYQVWAGDDLADPWHLRPGVRDKILDFARTSGVHFDLLDRTQPWPWKPGQFDLVMVHHVIEHLNFSPRTLLLPLIETIRDGGYLMVTVPSLVNLRKRIAVLRGRTNLGSYHRFYWNEGEWRGHIREYVRDDLRQLGEYLGLEVVEISTYHLMLNRLPSWARTPWKIATSVFPGWRDSWSLVARKPMNWNPTRAIENGGSATALDAIPDHR